MNKYFFILVFMVSCATTKEIKKPTIPVTKYKVGDCTYLIDPETGKGNRADKMKVVEITNKYYIYKWWVVQGGWAIDSNYRTHYQFEAMTKEIECPKTRRQYE